MFFRSLHCWTKTKTYKRTDFSNKREKCRDYLNVFEQGVATAKCCRCYLTKASFLSTRKEKEGTDCGNVFTYSRKFHYCYRLSGLARTRTSCVCKGKQIVMKLLLKKYDGQFYWVSFISLKFTGLAVIPVLRLQT